jgi:hypothetical protein
MSWKQSLAKKLKEIGRYGSFRLNQNVYGRFRTRFAGRRRGLAHALRGARRAAAGLPFVASKA